jgi:hypothetical protein
MNGKMGENMLRKSSIIDDIDQMTPGSGLDTTIESTPRGDSTIIKQQITNG